jgi:hypothetical protein
MKKIHVFAMLILMVTTAFWACQKDNVFSVLGDHHENTSGSSDRFHVCCASLSEGIVTLDVYHAGTVPGEFSFTWDGTTTIPHPDSCATCKQIEIKVVKKGTSPENAGLSFRQEVPINLSDLSISSDLLKDGTALKITNGSDNENPVYLFVGGGTGKGGECTETSGGIDYTNLVPSYPMIVVESSCNKGIWGNLWLKTDLSEQDSIKPSFTYLMPVNIPIPDSLYGYTPKAGDRVYGMFSKVESADVCADRKADTQAVNVLSLRKR